MDHFFPISFGKEEIEENMISQQNMTALSNFQDQREYLTGYLEPDNLSCFGEDHLQSMVNEISFELQFPYGNQIEFELFNDQYFTTIGLPCQNLYQFEQVDLSESQQQFQSEVLATNLRKVSDSKTIPKRKQEPNRKRDQKFNKKAEHKPALLELQETQIDTQFQESLDDNLYIPSFQRTGRPFAKKNKVNQDGTEDKVKEKRSIFRAAKKIIGSLVEKDFKIRKNLCLKKNLLNDSKYLNKQELAQFFTDCKQCMSFDQYTKKVLEEMKIDIKEMKENEEIPCNFTFKNGQQRYIPIIGDPCYRYKRYVKEEYFNNALYRRVFLHLYFFIKDDKQICPTEEYKKALEELFQYGKSLEKDTEFLKKYQDKEKKHK